MSGHTDCDIHACLHSFVHSFTHSLIHLFCTVFSSLLCLLASPSFMASFIPFMWNVKCNVTWCADACCSRFVKLEEKHERPHVPRRPSVRFVSLSRASFSVNGAMSSISRMRWRYEFFTNLVLDQKSEEVFKIKDLSRFPRCFC